MSRANTTGTDGAQTTGANGDQPLPGVAHGQATRRANSAGPFTRGLRSARIADADRATAVDAVPQAIKGVWAHPAAAGTARRAARSAVRAILGLPCSALSNRIFHAQAMVRWKAFILGAKPRGATYRLIIVILVEHAFHPF